MHPFTGDHRAPATAVLLQGKYEADSESGVPDGTRTRSVISDASSTSWSFNQLSYRHHKVKGAGSSPFGDSPTPRCPPVALEATRRADRRCSSNYPAAAEGCLFHEAYPGPSVLIKNKIPLTTPFEVVATGVSRWSVLAIQARLPVWPLVGDLDQGRYFARIDFLSRMSFPGSRLGLDLLRIGSLIGVNGPFPCRFKIFFFVFCLFRLLAVVWLMFQKLQ